MRSDRVDLISEEWDVRFDRTLRRPSRETKRRERKATQRRQRNDAHAKGRRGNRKGHCGLKKHAKAKKCKHFRISRKWRRHRTNLHRENALDVGNDDDDWWPWKTLGDNFQYVVGSTQLSPSEKWAWIAKNVPVDAHLDHYCWSNEGFFSPLYTCILKGDRLMVEWCLKSGADPNAVCYQAVGEGDPIFPLLLAYEVGDKCIQKLLMRYGAIPQICFLDSLRPLDSLRYEGLIAELWFLEYFWGERHYYMRGGVFLGNFVEFCCFLEHVLREKEVVSHKLFLGRVEELKMSICRRVDCVLGPAIVQLVLDLVFHRREGIETSRMR